MGSLAHLLTDADKSTALYGKVVRAIRIDKPFRRRNFAYGVPVDGPPEEPVGHWKTDRVSLTDRLSRQISKSRPNSRDGICLSFKILYGYYGQLSRIETCNPRGANLL